MIGRGLADIVDAAPHELAHGVGVVDVVDQAAAHILRAPGGPAVAQRGTLEILLRENARVRREMIDAAAGQDGRRLAAVDHPVRMLGVVPRIVLLAVIVAGDLYQVGAALRALPGHVIAAQSDRRISPGIVGARRVPQHGGDLRATGGDMGIVNLIADGPQDHARMVPVPPHPAPHVPGPAFREEAGVIVGRLGALPHVGEFVDHQHAQLIADVQRAAGRRIVGSAQGVDAHLLHDPHLAAEGLGVERRAQRAEIVMQAHTAKLERLAVQEEAPVRVKLSRSEADAPAHDLFAADGLQGVEAGRIAAPHARVIHRQQRLPAA